MASASGRQLAQSVMSARRSRALPSRLEEYVSTSRKSEIWSLEHNRETRTLDGCCSSLSRLRRFY
jgi:hypothetical protein